MFLGNHFRKTCPIFLFVVNCGFLELYKLYFHSIEKLICNCLKTPRRGVTSVAHCCAVILIHAHKVWSIKILASQYFKYIDEVLLGKLHFLLEPVENGAELNIT